MEQKIGAEWSDDQIKIWANSRERVRDYAPILSRINALSGDFNITQYGALSHNPDRYPLYHLTSKKWDNTKPNILITGGVHGYEPSGIFAALEFLEKQVPHLKDKCNFVCFPCISPWAYEHDQRWDINAEDPNRGFRRVRIRRDVEESVLFMNALDTLGHQYAFSIDLHETSDRDKVLRRERASRFGTELVANPDHMQDGFYLVLDPSYEPTGNKPDIFGESIINAVKKVTKIAPDPEVLNRPNHNGIVYAEFEGLLADYLRREGFTKFAATTEVYPNSISNDEAIAGQIAAIEGGIKFLERNLS